MFGIPSMIRAITGTIVSTFQEMDKSVSTLAKQNQVWHSSTEINLKSQIKSTVYSKAVEIEKEIDKSKKQLNEINKDLISQIDLELEQYFIKQNKD
jgi:hypothetical protein